MREDYLWINEYNKNWSKIITLIFVIFAIFVPFTLFLYLYSVPIESEINKNMIENNKFIIPLLIFPFVIFLTFKILITKYVLVDYLDNYYLYLHNRLFPKNILSTQNWIILDKIYLSRSSINKMEIDKAKIAGITFSGVNKTYTIHILPFYYNKKLEFEPNIIGKINFTFYKRNSLKFYFTILFLVIFLLIFLSWFLIFLRSFILYYDSNFDIYEYLTLFFHYSLPLILAYISAHIIFDYSHSSLLIFENYIIHGSNIINLQNLMTINLVLRRFWFKKRQSVQILLNNNSVYYIHDIYKFDLKEIYYQIKMSIKNE